MTIDTSHLHIMLILLIMRSMLIMCHSLQDGKRSMLRRLILQKAQQTEQAMDPSSMKTIAMEEFKCLESKYHELDKKAAILHQQYQQSKVDIVQLRQRHEREIENAKLYASQPFAKDLFTVYDTLAQAQRYATDSPAANGFEMIRKQMIEVFQKHRLHVIEPKEGDKFDHNVHEALYRMDHDTLNNDDIGKVEKVGFQLNDRVVRAAQVGVVQKKE